MALIDEIRRKFASELFEFSRHATDQTLLWQIRVDEVRQAVQSGEIIEDYPDDKYGPIHLQCSYPSRPIIKVITVYEPNPGEWMDDRFRR